MRLNDPLSFVTVDSVTTAVAAAAFIGLADEVYHRIDDAWQFFRKIHDASDDVKSLIEELRSTKYIMGKTVTLLHYMKQNYDPPVPVPTDDSYVTDGAVQKCQYENKGKSKV